MKSAEEWSLGEVQPLLLQSSHIITLTHSLRSPLKMVGLFAPLFLISTEDYYGRTKCLSDFQHKFIQNLFISICSCASIVLKLEQLLACLLVIFT